MVMVGAPTITAAFGGNQLLLLLYPAVHVVIGELGPPPSQALGRPLGCPRAVRTVAATAGCYGVPRRPVSILALSQQSRRANHRLGKGVRKRVSPAEGHVDRLLFEQAQVDAAGSTPSLLPPSVPGLAAGPTVGTKVVVKEPRQVAGILQNDHQASEGSSRSR